MERKCGLFGKILCFLLSVVIFLFTASIFCACTGNNRYDGELLRLHIRANSNSDVDQGVKLKVRDAVNAYIAANVDKDTFEEAYADVGTRLGEIGRIAVGVLRANGFSYGARAK
ncbi:MAG: stage II sporulation protein R, partial [Clostridiales bacterium]|nr:stage II sporulation protein R [Clostridiales bacterium]